MEIAASAGVLLNNNGPCPQGRRIEQKRYSRSLHPSHSLFSKV